MGARSVSRKTVLFTKLQSSPSWRTLMRDSSLERNMRFDSKYCRSVRDSYRWDLSPQRAWRDRRGEADRGLGPVAISSTHPLRVKGVTVLRNIAKISSSASRTLA